MAMYVPHSVFQPSSCIDALLDCVSGSSNRGDVLMYPAVSHDSMVHSCVLLSVR